MASRSQLGHTGSTGVWQSTGRDGSQEFSRSSSPGVGPPSIRSSSPRPRLDTGGSNVNPAPSDYFTPTMLLGMEKHGVSRQSLENCIKQTDANGIDSLMAYFKSHFENEGQGPTTDTQKRHSTAEGFSDASRNPSSTALSSEPTTGRSPQPTAAQRPRALKKKAAAANKQQARLQKQLDRAGVCMEALEGASIKAANDNKLLESHLKALQACLKQGSQHDIYESELRNKERALTQMQREMEALKEGLVTAEVAKLRAEGEAASMRDELAALQQQVQARDIHLAALMSKASQTQAALVLAGMMSGGSSAVLSRQLMVATTALEMDHCTRRTLGRLLVNKSSENQRVSDERDQLEAQLEDAQAMLHKATLQLRGKDILIHGRGRRLKEQEAAYAWAEEVVGACADEIVSRNETINDLQEQLDLLHWQQWQAGLAADQPHEHASDAGKAVM